MSKYLERLSIKQKLIRDLFGILIQWERAGFPFFDVLTSSTSWAGKLTEKQRDDVASIWSQIKRDILAIAEIHDGQ